MTHRIQPRPYQHAFTLMELAIVLVIIGLLAGGVLAGQNLIRAAMLQSQVRQLTDYDTAIAAFRLKYDCLPGDCKTTNANWPDLGNGDGDEQVENDLNSYYDAAPGPSWSGSIEYRNFFITLGRAGFISGNFDQALPASNIPVVGMQLPALKLNKKAGFFASDTRSFTVLSAVSRNPVTDTLRRGTNALWLVACKVTASRVWGWDDNCGIFTAVELRNIDAKIDDGQPLRGKLFGFGGANSENDCLNINGGDLSQSTYKTINTSRQCQGAYILD